MAEHTDNPASPHPADQPAIPVQQTLPLTQFVPLTPGETVHGALGRYTIGNPMGMGHFGVVWECMDEWGSELVVKVLMPHRPQDEMRAMAIAEADRAFQLRHPNITYVYDAYQYKDQFHIVYERLAMPVSQLLTIDRFTPDVWVKPIARSVLKALSFIHAANLVHQDVHLGNVLVGWVKDELVDSAPGSMTFKIADLGLCKLASEIDAQNTVLADWIRAPEAIDSPQYGPMDHRMDLYHAGLLLLQVAVGKPLRFTRDEVLAGAPRQLAERLTAPMGPAIARSLRRHVNTRYSTAMEFWQALNAPLAALPELASLLASVAGPPK